MVVKKIGIVSLSSGLLGEEAVAHGVAIGLERLYQKGVEVEFLPHAQKGIAYVQEHPEKRAQDLLQALADPTIDLVLCAIGGDDTVRLSPYLFSENQLQVHAVQKPFLGFSDTTVNHLMLHKVGLYSFYGQAFIPDVCEIGSNMLPYTERYFDELLTTGRIAEIRPSDTWYNERTDFSVAGVGVELTPHAHQGFELLRGPAVFAGAILGGCLETLYSLLDEKEHAQAAQINHQYEIIPSLEDWNKKILLLETSEEQTEPTLFRKMIQTLRAYGLFDVVSGVLLGKPQDGAYEEEYKQILLEEIADESLPIVCNLNVGHTQPRCIVPLGVPAQVDLNEQVIRFDWLAVTNGVFSSLTSIVSLHKTLHDFYRGIDF